RRNLNRPKRCPHQSPSSLLPLRNVSNPVLGLNKTGVLQSDKGILSRAHQITHFNKSDLQRRTIEQLSVRQIHISREERRDDQPSSTARRKAFPGPERSSR